MAFTSICPASTVKEGGIGLFQTGRKSVLVVWPTGGELKAYRGRCPHADLPLTKASFNGQTVTCPIHQWGSGHIADGEGGRSAVLTAPYGVVEPFSLDELERGAGSLSANAW